MFSKNKSFLFQSFSLKEMQQRTSVRVGETKLGEVVQCLERSHLTPKYVLLGIQEDIGPQANFGNSGAKNTWNPTLNRILNVQSNRFFQGDELYILGSIISEVKFETIENARIQVRELDDFVVEILLPWIKKGCIPIVIGGGHNNAFPLIKASSLVLQHPISVINCDPHADFRALEGRHSGNSFSYAWKENWLNDYTIIGLHQSYNSEEMLTELEQKGVCFSFFDDFLSHPEKFDHEIEKAHLKHINNPVGIELDLDAIIDFPSSAITPSGISVNQARFYIQKMASLPLVCYLHLPEAAPTSSIEEAKVGKLISYLICDFIKNNLMSK
jgi:formiminoglutamase